MAAKSNPQMNAGTPVIFFNSVASPALSFCLTDKNKTVNAEKTASTAMKTAYNNVAIWMYSTLFK